MRRREGRDAEWILKCEGGRGARAESNQRATIYEASRGRTAMRPRTTRTRFCQTPPGHTDLVIRLINRNTKRFTL